jgi:DNA-binding CsgD family transcriptional regulator
MAKTLFFIEALALAAIALLFPLVAAEAATAFVLPLAASLLLPLACVVAIWPLRAVLRALRLAFSPPRAGLATAGSAAILEALGSFSRAAAVLGLILALASICARLPLRTPPRTLSLLGAYLAVYALVNAVLWQTLAAVAQRLSAGEPPAAHGQPAFGALFDLTPREAETARLIAAGRSYKEAAGDLGISVRTVKTHMSRVYEKTGAPSNVALSLLVRENGAAPTKVR